MDFQLQYFQYLRINKSILKLSLYNVAHVKKKMHKNSDGSGVNIHMHLYRKF